jgi:hypothetical protein
MSEVFLCDLDKISRWHLRPASHKCRHDKSTSRSDRALGVCWAYLFIQATQVVPDLLFKLLSLGDPIKHVQIISNCHSNPLMPPFSDGWPSRIVKSPRIARSIHDTYAHRVYTALNKCEANLQYSSIILYIYTYSVWEVNLGAFKFVAMDRYILLWTGTNDQNRYKTGSPAFADWHQRPTTWRQSNHKLSDTNLNRATNAIACYSKSRKVRDPRNATYSDVWLQIVVRPS